MKRVTRNVLFGSVGWFTLLDEHGVIERWLDSGKEDRLNLAFDLLRYVSDKRSNRAAALLMTRLDRDADWRTRVSRFMTWCPGLEASESLFNVLFAVIERGDLASLKERQTGIWGILHHLPERHPDRCAVAVGAYLRRLVEDAEQGNPFDEHDGFSHEVLDKCAGNAAKTFVDALLPLVLDVMGRSALRNGAPPHPDRIWWDGIFSRDHVYSLAGAV